MELRRRFGRFVVDARPAQAADGSGWLPNFTLEEHLPSYVEDTTFFGRQAFSTRKDAIRACHELGCREIARRLRA
jgi:hypothetical protein